MSLLTIKALSAVAIIVVRLVGGMIPIVAGRFDESRRFFSLGNAFAGGVFLGAGLIHLLPDGTEKLEAVSDFPIAGDRKSTRLNSSHMSESRMPSSA